MKKLVYTIGLLAALSYIISIMWVWVSAESKGYTYFTAGEPNELIRNTEWLLGIIAIIVLIKLFTEVSNQ